MSGQIGILNVGAGDTKLTFDKSNPAECIRSGRIVQDMLRRGYALLVEVDDGKGGKSFTRVHDFDPDKCEYIIADGPLRAVDPAAIRGAADEETAAKAPAAAGTFTGDEGPRETPTPQPRLRGRTRSVSATEARGVAVGRSAGG